MSFDCVFVRCSNDQGPQFSAARGIPSRAAEFGFLPWNFTAEFVFLPRNAAEFDVFHSNNYFFTENDLKVALLQVCLL